MVDKGNKDMPDIFEKEIAKLPEELKSKLLSSKKYIEEVVEAINKKALKNSVGFYINPKIEMQNNMPVPNFDEMTLIFMLDDTENPISQFNPRVLIGEDFDKLLLEEKKKNEYNEEYFEYKLKKNTKIKFQGTSISFVRENCFDAIYDDLKSLGSSFVYQDNRGFISALKSIDIHRNLLLQKFEKYIVVYAGAGSWLRGEKSNDFDVFVVVDDTDVKRMPRMQVKDQLTRIIWQMAAEVAQLTGIQLHAQVYLLTDFWDALKDAHPVMFTFLRDGVPFYDRGIYSAWKELLKLGKIRPSAEAIDMHMNVGTQLIDRAKKMLADIVINDLYNAILSPSQALVMLKGFNPTTPKETVRIFKDVLLEKEKCITQADVDTFESTVALFKKLEHDRSYQVTGKEIDKLIKNGEKFLEKVKNIFEEISEDKTKESILTTYSEVINQIQSLPGFAKIAQKDLIKKFEEKFVDTGILQPFVKEYLENLIKSKEMYEKGKLKSSEVHQVLKQARNVLSEIKEYRSRLLSNDFGRRKFIVEYGDKQTAEIMNYKDNMYLLNLAENKLYDLDKEKEVKVETIDLNDISQFTAIELTSGLIDKIKSLLDVKEIRF